MADGYEGSRIVSHEYKIGSMSQGYVYWSVETGENVPAAIITNSPSTLRYSVTTTAEWWEIDRGSKLTVRLAIDNAANKVSEEKNLIMNNLGNNKVGQFYDINIYKRMNLAGEAKVLRPHIGTNIIMVVPAEAFNTDVTKIRVYSMMYVDNGEVKTTPVFRTIEGFLSYTAPISTTYALVYQDINNPQYQ